MLTGWSGGPYNVSISSESSDGTTIHYYQLMNNDEKVGKVMERPQNQGHWTVRNLSVSVKEYYTRGSCSALLKVLTYF